MSRATDFNAITPRKQNNYFSFSSRNTAQNNTNREAIFVKKGFKQLNRTYGMKDGLLVLRF